MLFFPPALNHSPLPGLLLLALTSGLASGSAAQSVRTTVYGSAQGLPSPKVYDVLEDQDGSIWAATAKGVAVWDGGKQWLAYRTTDSSSNDAMHHLALFPSGQVHALAEWTDEAGLLIFEDSAVPFPPLESGRRSRVQAVAVIYGAQGAALIVGTEDCRLFTHEGLEWLEVEVPPAYLGAELYDLVALEGQTILCTDRGITAFNGREFDLELNDRVASREDVANTVMFDPETFRTWVVTELDIGYFYGFPFRSMVFDLKGWAEGRSSHRRLLPDGTGGLVLLVGNELFHLFHEPSPSLALTFNEVNELLRPGRGSGTGSDIFRPERIPIQVSLGIDGEAKAIMDKDKHMWITSASGLVRLPTLLLMNYGESEGLMDAQVTAIHESPVGRLVLGQPGGLCFLDLTTSHVLPDNLLVGMSQEEPETVIDIDSQIDGTLWFVTDRGLLRSLGVDGEGSTAPPSALPGRATCVFADYGGRLWVGTERGIVLWESDESLELEGCPIGSRVVRQISGGGAGTTVFLVEGLGAVLRTPSGWKTPKSDLYAGTADVRDFTRMMGGELYFGTEGGLARVIDNALELPSPEEFPEEFPADSLSGAVDGLLTEGSGALWIADDRGIGRIDSAGRRVFTRDDGLASEALGRGGFFEDSRGRVWIATDNGLSCYRSDFRVDTARPPTVAILGAFDSSGSLVTDGTLQRIGPTDLRFRIKSDRPSKFSEIRYQVKLEGMDVDWRPSEVLTKDEIFLANIPPGSYRLALRLETEYSGVGAEVYSMPIRVRPPFLQRKSTLAAIGLLLLTVGFFLRKWVETRAHSRVLETMVGERTAQLSESEARYRVLFEDSLNAQALLKKPGGEIVFVNDPLCRMLEEQCSDLEDGSKRLNEFLHSGAAELEEILGNRSERYRLLVKLVSKQGTVREVELYASPMITGSEETLHLTLYDVTERRRLEHSLARSERIGAMGKLAASIAHDFNNLMMTVLGSSELILAVDPESRHRALVQDIHDAGKRGAGMVATLMEESHDQGSVSGVCDLVAVVGDFRQALELILGPDVELQFELSPAKARINRIHVENILHNLANNARDAMDRIGRLEVTVRTMDQGQGPSPSAPGGWVRLSVFDNGSGMTEDVRRQVFDPFFSTKNPGHGTGIGLAGVKSVIDLLGGQIECESTLGKGTAFHIYLENLDSLAR